MDNDNLIGCAITECRHAMRELSTKDSVTAAYNLLSGYFRLCCVCGDPEDLKLIAKEVYEGLLDEMG